MKKWIKNNRYFSLGMVLYEIFYQKVPFKILEGNNEKNIKERLHIDYYTMHKKFLDSLTGFTNNTEYDNLNHKERDICQQINKVIKCAIRLDPKFRPNIKQIRNFFRSAVKRLTTWKTNLMQTCSINLKQKK